MKRLIPILLTIATACTPVQMMDSSPTPAATEPASIPTQVPAIPAETVNAPELSANGFTELPDPVCTGLTPENMEGPYYKPNTPERNSLLEEGLQGDKLIVIGYVLDINCDPIPNAWLDFWQANASGNYDNEGYTLRGHQFTDEEGRYFLETIMPGLYSSRPIEHIHVKVQRKGGALLTTQLYFPQQPVDGLTVDLEKKDGYYLAIFNFVVQ